MNAESGLKILEQLSRRLNKGVENLVCVMGIAMAVIVATQVFSRYVLNHSLFWSEEIARFLLVGLTFLGATAAYYHGAHPGVDGLYQRLPKVAKQTVNLVTISAGLGLFLIMIGHGIGFAWFVRLQITPAIGIPKWIILGIVPVSGLIFMTHGITFFCQELWSLISRNRK